MAFSERTDIADGVQTDFNIPFDYLEQDHVTVAVDKILTTAPGAEYQFVFTNPTTVRVTHRVTGNPPPSGAEVTRGRTTPIDTPAVVFGGGASLPLSDLNTLAEYLTFALQEATDANDAFTVLYLGAFATAPSTDNEGGALITGALYFDTVQNALFAWSGSAWETTQGLQGIQGEPGLSILNGAGDPGAGTGVNGDFYINTTTSTLFGPKAGGAWPAGVNLIGPAGADGVDGTNGTDGVGVPSGGTTGQVLRKASGTNFDTEWATPTQQASQAEAEAGVENTKFMTPLRVAQVITAKSIWVPIQRQVVSSAVANLDFALDNTNYEQFRLEFEFVNPVTNNVIPRLRLSTDGGTTFADGASDYFRYNAYTGGAGYNGDNGNASGFLLVDAGNAQASGSDGLTGEVIIQMTSSSTRRTTFRGNLLYNANVAGFRHMHLFGRRQTAEVNDVVRLEYNSGNIDEGTVTLFGMPNIT